MLRLYTDESPGLKVDPVVVLVLSLGFIMSVVALHSELTGQHVKSSNTDNHNSHSEDLETLRIDPSFSNPEMKHCIWRGRNRTDFGTTRCLRGGIFKSLRWCLAFTRLDLQLRIALSNPDSMWWTSWN